MSQFLIILFLSLSLIPSLHARKLLGAEKLSSTEEDSVQNALLTEKTVPPPSPMDGGERFVAMEKVSPMDLSLYLSALPKGTVPPSAPSNKIHAAIVDERLFAMHLAKMDRILKSVPSPGVGH